MQKTSVGDSAFWEAIGDRPMTRGELRAVVAYIRELAIEIGDLTEVMEAEKLLERFDRAERLDPRRC